MSMRIRSTGKTGRDVLRAGTIVTAAALIAGGCATELDVPGGDRTAPNGVSRAYGIWTPGPDDTCTKEIHDSYSVVGPDGKLYPTWHPPVDPESGCSFGHEHGRDPRGSNLYEVVGDIPFGHANEQLAIYDPLGIRDEDHVGHKIEWQNDIVLHFSEDVAAGLLEVKCNVLTKLHQGTHSKDAFTNNLHEIVYHIRCTDRTEFHITMLTPIGEPGEFRSSCDREDIVVGPPVPANSPSGGGRRLIPDRSCIEEFLLVPEGERSSFGSGLRESWEISAGVRSEDGRSLVRINPYFQARFPSRFYDPDSPDGVGRVIDLCLDDGSELRARGDLCDESTSGGQLGDLTYDDPRSQFNGVLRFVDINSNIIRNADGPEIWYSDPFGKNARTEPFPGSIAQVIAAVDNTRAINPSGPTIGKDRDYGGRGVHAPN